MNFTKMLQNFCLYKIKWYNNMCVIKTSKLMLLQQVISSRLTTVKICYMILCN